MTTTKTTSKARLAARAKNISFLFAAIAGSAFLVAGARSAALAAQSGGGLNPADLLKPLADSWPSYSGDYTGRRNSALTQVNQSNVKHLAAAFATKHAGGPSAGSC